MKQAPQKIVPHLWFDKEAREAATFYCDIFPASGISNTNTLHGTPSGDVDVVSFTLRDYDFMAISAGPPFKFNPSVSFIVSLAADDRSARELETIWYRLAEGGKVLMPLDNYPFSKRYGWIQDKYGLSWQLMLSEVSAGEVPSIIPSLLFTGELCGKAEAASEYYLSIFRDAQRGMLARYPQGMEPDKEGTVMYTDFNLEKQRFAAMDSARGHDFSFNEAISFMVYCDSQAEIDYYWQLSAVPEAEQCGWLKDSYGLSWQIVPRSMTAMLQDKNSDRLNRVTQAFLTMKKFDLAALQKVYEGEE